MQLQMLIRRGVPVEGLPKAVNAAASFYAFFKAANEIPVFEGVLDGPWTLRKGVSIDSLERMFLKQLILNGGSESDFVWLIRNGYVSPDEMNMWHDVIEDAFTDVTPEQIVGS